MRTRQEIEKQFQNWSTNQILRDERIIEVLLDIRHLLSQEKTNSKDL